MRPYTSRPAALVLALFLVAACTPAGPGSPAASTPGPAATPAAPAGSPGPATYSIGTAARPLRVATSPAIPFVPAYATMERLRARHGLTVSFVEIASSAERTLALVKGDVDLYVGGIATLLTQIEKGEPIVMFMNTGTLGTGIIVGRDVQDWAALKGKPIVTAKGSVMHMQLLDELKQNGLSDQDVQLQFATRNQDMIAALKQGQVAAVSGLEPFLSEAVVDGYARFLSFPYSTRVGWRVQGAWAARADFLEQHADVVQLIADENVALVKQYHEQPATFLDDAMRLLNFKADYRPVVEASAHNLALPVGIDAAALKDMEGTARFMVEFGQLKAVPDLTGSVNSRFVDQAQRMLNWSAPVELYSLLKPPAWDPSYRFPTR